MPGLSSRPTQLKAGSAKLKPCLTGEVRGAERQGPRSGDQSNPDPRTARRASMGRIARTHPLTRRWGQRPQIHLNNSVARRRRASALRCGWQRLCHYGDEGNAALQCPCRPAAGFVGRVIVSLAFFLAPLLGLDDGNLTASDASRSTGGPLHSLRSRVASVTSRAAVGLHGPIRPSSGARPKKKETTNDRYQRNQPPPDPHHLPSDR